MYYNGEFKMVSFFEVKKLAKNGTDVIYIEKMGMVEAFKDFADQYRIALVNSQGQLTDYAKELADLALESGGHVFLVTDYDVPGVIIASKLGPNVPWIGINKQTIERFNIPLPSLPNPHGISKVKKYPVGEERHVVVPYDVKTIPKEKEWLRRLVELGENEIEDEETGEKEIVKDTRFSPDKVDLDWLWADTVKRRDKKGRERLGVEGHKIEIDAIVKDQGSENMWHYMLEQIAASRPKRDYTRVIPSHVYSDTPEPPYLSDDISASSVIYIISDKLRNYLKDRISEITQDKRQKIKEELENYEGFIDDIPKKEQGYRNSVINIAYEDAIVKDIVLVVESIRDAVEEEEGLSDLQEQIEEIASKVNEAIIKALKKLDADKGYGIMKALGMDDEEEGGGKSEN